MLAFGHMARLWLTAPDRGPARWMLVALVLLTVAQVAIQVRFNIWNRDFFNALESRDGAAFRLQILIFLGLAALSVGVVVYQLYLKNLIQLAWRSWLTKHLLDAWLREGRHYQLDMAAGAADNPDQRIAEDVRIVTDLAMDFATGLLTSVLMLSTFIGILWNLSGAMQFSLGGHEVGIPGHMVWAALAYALLGSSLTFLLGRPLILLNVQRAGAEADLRFGLTRARESGEGIALISGEADERRSLMLIFADVSNTVLGLFRSQRNLMWLTSAYGTLAMIVPTIIASPAYFAGTLTLGGLMQIGAAFAQVQGALNWFVDNNGRIAEWRSAVSRIIAFRDVIEDLDALVADPEQPTITIRESDDGRLVLRNLEVAFADGTSVIADASAEIAAGERVLLDGESGSGKSTLFRAIAGLWPWGAGEILTPPRSEMMFLPPCPYLPLGSLATVVAYPSGMESFPPEALAAALADSGLERLAGQLERVERWDRTLSLADQQRISFARLLLHKPGWIFMDEATSALDEVSEAALMGLVLERMPGAALISIGQHSGLAQFHTRKLVLVRAEGGARLSPPRRQNPVRKWIRPA